MVHPSTKFRATLFAGALAISCGLLLATTGTDWYHPISKEEVKTDSPDEESSHSDTREKFTSSSDYVETVNEDSSFRETHSSPQGFDHDKLDDQRKLHAWMKPGNITIWTSTASGPLNNEHTSSGLAVAITKPASITNSPRNKSSCLGFVEIFSSFDTPVKQNDPMIVNEEVPECQMEASPGEDSVQEFSSESVESVLLAQIGNDSSLSPPSAENHALNPLAVPFHPVTRLNPHSAPFQPSRRRLNPNATPFEPSQRFGLDETP